MIASSTARLRRRASPARGGSAGSIASRIFWNETQRRLRRRAKSARLARSMTVVLESEGRSRGPDAAPPRQAQTGASAGSSVICAKAPPSEIAT